MEKLWTISVNLARRGAARSYAEAARQRTTFRTPDAPPSTHRRRPVPARWHRALQRAPAALRDRHRHDALAHGQTFHVVADARAEKQDLRGAPLEQSHATVREPGRCDPST